MNSNITATVPELSKMYGIPESTIRKLCHKGKLAYLELGNKWYIRIVDFEALFKTNTRYS